MRQLKEAIQQNECVLCALHQIAQSESDAELRVSSPIPCTEDPNTLSDQTRQVLLNDGREFHVLTTSRSDSAEQDYFSASRNLGSSQPQNPVRARGLPAITGQKNGMPDAMMEDNLEGFLPQLMTSGNSGSSLAARAAKVQSDLECQLCGKIGFMSVVELERHANEHLA